MSDKASKYGSLYEDEEVYLPPNISGAQLNSMPGYQKMYERSIQSPSEFWISATKDLYFQRRSQKCLEYNFDVRKGPIFTRFMDGSTSNLSYNCLERIIGQGKFFSKGNKIAYKFEGNEPDDCFEITYVELLKRVVNCAAVLRSKGVKKGDTVALYLPMILELPICMLACARIGATHAVIFAGFSADAVSQRLIQANARFVVTADSFARGSKIIKLKDIADESLEICCQHGHNVQTLLVVEHSRNSKFPANQKIPECKWNPQVDCKWAEEMEKCADADCPVEWVDAEHPSFVLYTSGSTGVPKGIVHSTVGYMTYAYSTMKYNFASQEDDVYWCTADCGWITGHSYVVYGPLLNGITSVIYEGVPNYPAANRMWAIVEKYQVTKLYTAPTVARSLMAYPEHLVTDHDLSSLKVIGTVGEPLNAGAFKWLYNVVGQQRCSMIDTYWQTETGGHMIILLDNDGNVIEGPGEGNLCFTSAWPGISRTVLGDHERFEKTYYQPFPGYYFTGDGARRDKHGYFYITGRVDDLMNVSGHLLSTAEIESALATHPEIVESAVVAAEHPIKGQSVYAFVVPAKGKQLTKTMELELKTLVRQHIGAIATPDVIHVAHCGLPKTRSGKITRRILRKIADNQRDADLGDLTTLIDTTVIDQLWATRMIDSRVTIRAG
ncbi:Acetyl-coenzyme A synthetase [Aphelenchoides bicaudatus]|nr:Acetyl-coenzyme A synthetase [Aphelenchoides bicaudatus]